VDRRRREHLVACRTRRACAEGGAGHSPGAD
jgi:hypothetical protein